MDVMKDVPTDLLYIMQLKMDEILESLQTQSANDAHTEDDKLQILCEIIFKTIDAALAVISTSDIKKKIGAKVFILDEIQEAIKTVKQYSLDLC